MIKITLRTGGYVYKNRMMKDQSLSDGYLDDKSSLVFNTFDEQLLELTS